MPLPANPARHSSPFIGASFRHPSFPESSDPRRWEDYSEELAEKIFSLADYGDLEMGPQLLDAKIRNWNRRSLPAIIGLRGVVTDAAGEAYIVRHGYSDGLLPEEMVACVAGARRGLAQLAERLVKLEQDGVKAGDPENLHVLGRARRARRPGTVFARAAADNTVDPLVDIESRLIVGLPANPS